MKERILKELEVLEAQERQITGTFNAVMGAKQVLNKLLQELNAVEIAPEDIKINTKRT